MVLSKLFIDPGAQPWRTLLAKGKKESGGADKLCSVNPGERSKNSSISRRGGGLWREISFAMGNALGALEKRVEAGIRQQGRYFVSAPAERARLGDAEAALAFARWHGWMFVCHLGGAHYEFFEARPGQQLY